MRANSLFIIIILFLSISIISISHRPNVPSLSLLSTCIPIRTADFRVEDSQQFLRFLAQWQQREIYRSVLLVIPNKPKNKNRKNKSVYGIGSIAGWIRPNKGGTKSDNSDNKIKGKGGGNGKRNGNDGIRGIQEEEEEEKEEEEEEDEEETGWIEDRCDLRVIALGPMDLERKVRKRTKHLTLQCLGDISFVFCFHFYY